MGIEASVQRLNEVIIEESLEEELQQDFKEHLSSLEQEFRRYCHNIDANENAQIQLARNPFCCNVDDLPHDIQVEFLELINKFAAKEEFQE